MGIEHGLKLVRIRNKIINISEWVIPFICGLVSYGLCREYLTAWYYTVAYCVGTIIISAIIDRLFRFAVDFIFKKKFYDSIDDQ